MCTLSDAYIGLANYGFFYKGIKPGQKIEGKLDKYGVSIRRNAPFTL